jgi:ferredoxin
MTEEPNTRPLADPAVRPRITVDRDLCMGSGMCIMYAPATFVHDDETKATILDPVGDPMEHILTALEACPTGALTLVSAPEKGE